MRKTVQIEEKIKKEFPNLSLSNKSIEQLNEYIRLLSHWNSKINLTAIREVDVMIVKLLLDALVVFAIKDIAFVDLLKSGRVLDLGSGAGIPGIILAICNAELDVVSVDKSSKKIGFQDQVVRQLKLRNIKPVNNRLETLASFSENRFAYDVIVSRAFDQLKTILCLGDQFLKQGGHYILWKGKNWQKELDEVDGNTLKKCTVCSTHRYDFHDYSHGGVILLIKKCEER